MAARTINYFASGIDSDGEVVKCDCHSLSGARMFVSDLKCWEIKNLAGVIESGGFDE